MANALEFILKLQDMLSPGMRQAAQISNTASAQIESQFARITGSSRRMNASVDELRARLDAINRVRFSTTIEREFNVATRAANRLERQIERLENRGRNGGGGLGLGGILSTAAMGMAGNDIIRTGVKDESLNRAINFTTNGQGAAATSQLTAMNDKYGINNMAGQEGFKTISASVRSLNFDMKQQMDIYEGVAAGAATFNLTAEDSKLAFLALGQMASKGKVSAEELRGQLGERIPGAFGIAAKAMGVTEIQLNKMMESGQLLSKDFLPRFATQMKKEFGQSAIDAATGAAANMHRFDNTMHKIKVTIAKDILPPFITFLKTLRVGIEWISENKDFVYPVIAGLGAVILATNGWAAAQGLVNMVMAMNPIFLVIGAVVLLGGWIYMVMKRYDGWGKSMQAVWEITKSFVSLSITAWKSLGESIWFNIEYGWLKFRSFIEWIGGAVQNISNAFALIGTGNFGAAKDALFKEIVTPSSKAIDELQNKHTRSQAALAVTAASTIKSITDNYNKIGLNYNVPGKGKVSSLSLNTGGGDTPGGLPPGPLGNGAKSKADSINGGGQRSIVINIGKQIEKLEVHVMDAKEGVNEIEAMVKEALRRTMYSLNGVAS